MAKKDQLLAVLFIVAMTVILGFTSVSKLQEMKQESAQDTYIFLNAGCGEDL